MKDIYQEITNNIIEQLESGVIPWAKPWSGSRNGAISYSTGRPYSLLNQMLIRDCGEYATFNQVKAAGGSVNKGAKAKTVVFWKVYRKEEENAETGEKEEVTIPVLKYFQVFNIEKDCTGIAPKWNRENAAIASPDEEAEKIFRSYLKKYNIRLEQVKSDEAFYAPSADFIHLPLMEQFDKTAEYYGTAFHESVHSTGHKSRLNRFETASGVAAFGSQTYSKEELVAEIGSAFLCSEAGIDTASSRKNNAAYIQSWLRVLKNDKKFIVSAASRAEKAVEMILGSRGESPDSPGRGEEKKPEIETPAAPADEVKAPAAEQEKPKAAKAPKGYNIRCRDKGLVYVDGYCFEFDGFRFGVTNKTPGGEKVNYWTVSELTTGFSVTGIGEKTKKAAIKYTMEIVREKRAAIEKAISMVKEDANPGLIPLDVIYTAGKGFAVC